MNRFFVILASLALATCSTIKPFDPGPQPINYRQMVADNLTPIKGVELLNALISSTLAPSVASQPGNWVTCLKTNPTGKARLYLVYFTPKVAKDAGEKVTFDIGARLSVGTDRCEGAIYGPLPAATPKMIDKEFSIRRR